MRRTPARAGISKLAPLAALAIILLAVGAYIFLSSRSTSPPSSTGRGSSSPTPVRDAVDEYVQDLNDRSVNALSSFYTSNSVVLWSGELGGLQGRYVGTQQITLLYGASIGKTTEMNATTSNYTQIAQSPTLVNASFNLVLHANSTVAGVLNAAINVVQEWSWANDGWQISKETWAYTLFYSSQLTAELGTPTTFPQWGYELKGGNPNLVSEKSFEWHAGPYVAATVYAFLFGVVTVGALRVRSRRPSKADG
jgi:hypothetical protein